MSTTHEDSDVAVVERELVQSLKPCRLMVRKGRQLLQLGQAGSAEIATKNPPRLSGTLGSDESKDKQQTGTAHSPSEQSR